MQIKHPKISTGSEIWKLSRKNTQWCNILTYKKCLPDIPLVLRGNLFQVLAQQNIKEHDWDTGSVVPTMSLSCTVLSFRGNQEGLCHIISIIIDTSIILNVIQTCHVMLLTVLWCTGSYMHSWQQNIIISW